MPAHALHDVLQRLDNAARAARRPAPRLLAVSKTQPAGAVAALADAWLRLPGRDDAVPVAFGENYVQEALAKRTALAGSTSIEWHLIGHLQSNKARDAAAAFDWVQSVDRLRLVDALARHRDPTRAPLQVLLQVNIDDESSKNGCHPDELPALAAAVAAAPTLRLRGLMVIPAPHADIGQRRPAFVRTHGLFEALRHDHPQLDTLSMGMSDDLEVAIAEGATMVRVGTALFGKRPSG